MKTPAMLSVALLMAATPAHATILTFDVDITQPTTNIAMPQSYGDRVTAPLMGTASYGTVSGDYTPNILVSYGPSSGAPTRWTDGYGDLTNVYENEVDGDTLLSITFAADVGYLANLFSFDMAGYFQTDYTIPGVKVVDEMGNVLFSQNNFLVQGALDGTAHSTFNFGAGLSANSLSILVDLTGLGGASDNIGIDNVYFGQSQVGVSSAVPEPASWAMMICGFGLVGGMIRRRPRSKVSVA